MTSLEFLVSKFGTVEGDHIWQYTLNKPGSTIRIEPASVIKLVTALRELQTGYDAARAAPAAVAAEPVAWMRDWDVYDPSNSGPEFSHTKKKKSEGWAPLYTAQPVAQGTTTDEIDVPYQCPYFGPSPHRDVWLAGWYACKAQQNT